MWKAVENFFQFSSIHRKNSKKWRIGDKKRPFIPHFFDLSTNKSKIFVFYLFGKLMSYPQFCVKKRKKSHLSSRNYLVCAFFEKVIHNSLKNRVDNLFFIHIRRG